MLPLGSNYFLKDKALKNFFTRSGRFTLTYFFVRSPRLFTSTYYRHICLQKNRAIWGLPTSTLDLSLWGSRKPSFLSFFLICSTTTLRSPYTQKIRRSHHITSRCCKQRWRGFSFLWHDEIPRWDSFCAPCTQYWLENFLSTTGLCAPCLP